MTFVNLVQEKIQATTSDTERDAGYREGLTEALALMLQATVDETQRT
jgi:hypothetical protein